MNKLSTLIREGAAKRPIQVRNMLIAPVDAGGYGTCAIGAALDATGYNLLAGRADPGDRELYRIFDLDPIQVESPIPEDKGFHVGVWDMIIRLNDTFDWSREQIADWLLLHRPVMEEEQETIRVVVLGRYEYRLERGVYTGTYSIVCADNERKQHTMRHTTDDMPGGSGRPITLVSGNALIDARVQRDQDLKR